MLEETLVFIDEGFLSKLSKYMGEGDYIKIDYIRFAKNIAKKQSLFLKNLFYYTAPPFQDSKPTKEQIKRKEGYDKFVTKFKKNNEVILKEGRCQKITNEHGEIGFRQKGVDALMVADMVSVPIKFPKIKKIILVTSDTDFCPIISQIEELGINVLLYTYYEKKRNSKFSISHHLIDSCKNTFYLNKEDLKNSKLNKNDR
jgi:uncharacterized LabA/DUF88 family protein